MEAPRVIELHDEVKILAVLESDRVWAAYALCDLDQPYRRHARFVASMVGGQADAVLLIYRPPGFSVLVPCGQAGGVQRIMEEVRDLPEAPLVMLREDDAPFFESRYHLERPTSMLRMVVTAGRLLQAGRCDAKIVRLTPADWPQLEALYRLWPENSFRPEMLEHGVAFGGFDGERLVAAAGAHAMSPRYRIGTIGGVFTHPDYRSRGLAKAVTAGAAEALVDAGIEDIALNVYAQNEPAISAYRRIGFVPCMGFAETQATLRSW
ncbi:MAG: GNAT family N-acetyltransferase [Chloroflexota bacterium]